MSTKLEFIPNGEYIDRLIKHSLMQKSKDQKTSSFLMAFEDNKLALSRIEAKMSSYEIIQNTKIAFKD